MNGHEVAKKKLANNCWWTSMEIEAIAAAAAAADAVRDCMLNYVICVYFHLVMNL